MDLIVRLLEAVHANGEIFPEVWPRVFCILTVRLLLARISFASKLTLRLVVRCAYHDLIGQTSHWRWPDNPTESLATYYKSASYSRNLTCKLN
jgi:hypothetical protein